MLELYNLPGYYPGIVQALKAILINLIVLELFLELKEGGGG
jgi:hypothetical protein